jgi:hypothetical protein
VNLQQASRCLFAKSQICLIVAFIAGVAVLTASIISFFKQCAFTDLILILVIAIAQVVQLAAKLWAMRRFALGDSLRRMDQLQNGLGISPDSLRMADAEKIVGICDAPADPNYWRTKLPQGPHRLVEMVEESAFFTESISGTCANCLWLLAVVGVSICIISLIAAVRLGISGPATEFASHIIVAVLVFFLAGDSILMYLQYSDLKDAAHSSLQRVEYLLAKTDLSAAEAMGFAMEYNAAVTQAPPLISVVHRSNRKGLDALFSRYKEAQRIDKTS